MKNLNIQILFCLLFITIILHPQGFVDPEKNVFPTSTKDDISDPRILLDSLLSKKFTLSKSISKNASSKSLVDSLIFLKADGSKKKYIYKYDVDGSIIQETSLKWNNNRWTYDFRKSYDFDSFGNRIYSIKEFFEGKLWVKLDEHISEYSNTNKFLSGEHYSLYDDKWQLMGRSKAEYSNENVVVYQNESFFNGETWRFEYFYDQKNRDSLIIRYNWHDGDFENFRKWTYNYSSEYYSLIKNYFVWENNKWAKERTSNQVLDNNDTIIEELSELWDDDKLENSYWYIANYDGIELSQNSQSYEWIDEQWIVVYSADYRFDQNNNQIFSEYKRYDNSILVNGQRIERAYDSNNRQILEIYYNWNGSVWSQQEKTEHKYDNTNKIIKFRRERLHEETDQLLIEESNYNYDQIGNLTFVESLLLTDAVITSIDKVVYLFDSKNRLMSINNLTWNNSSFIEHDSHDYYYHNNGIPYVDESYSKKYIYHKDSELIIREDLPFQPKYTISQNYPNPFNPTTLISFSTTEETNIKIILYNNLGERVKNITEGLFKVGTHYIEMSSSGLASGTYYYRLEAEKTTKTKKMIILQ